MEADHNELKSAALEIVDAAGKSGITLRLLGAVGFAFECPVHQDLQVSMLRVLAESTARPYEQEKAIDKLFLRTGLRVAERGPDPRSRDRSRDLLRHHGRAPARRRLLRQAEHVPRRELGGGGWRLTAHAQPGSPDAGEAADRPHQREGAKDVMMLLLEQGVGAGESGVVNGGT